MNDRFVPTEDVVERMLQRRAARGDFTGLLFKASDLVAQTPQRRHPFGWWARPWDVRLGRWAVVGVALVAVISVAGIALLGGPWRASVTGPVAPAGTPSPSPTDSASAAPLPAPTPRPTRTASPAPAPTPLLRLAPGTYSSQVWQPQLTFSVPDGWWNDADDRTAFVLSKGHESPDNIELLVDLYPPGTDCGMAPDWNRPHSVDDLMEYLAGNPRIDLVSREAVSLGGLDGWHVVTEGSETSNCQTPMAYMVHWHDGIPFGHGAAGRQEFFFLDGLDGRTIGIAVRAEGAVRDEETAIIESFEFDLASEAPGKRRSEVFVPQLTFTAATTWGIAEEDVALLSLRHGPNNSIDVIANVFPPTNDGDGCQRGLTMGRDSADRMVAYWTSHPGVVASTPEPFAVGDVTGWRVDVSRDPDWSPSCPGDSGLYRPPCPSGSTSRPCEPVDFLHLWNGNGVQGSGISEQRKTLIVLDLPDGPTIGIRLALHDTPALEEEALAIVKSFVFAPDGP